MIKHPYFDDFDGLYHPFHHGKPTKNMERSTIFNGKSHYKRAIFHSYVSLPEGKGN